MQRSELVTVVRPSSPQAPPAARHVRATIHHIVGCTFLRRITRARGRLERARMAPAAAVTPPELSPYARAPNDDLAALDRLEQSARPLRLRRVAMLGAFQTRRTRSMARVRSHMGSQLMAARPTSRPPWRWVFRSARTVTRPAAIRPGGEVEIDMMA